MEYNHITLYDFPGPINEEWTEVLSMLLQQTLTVYSQGYQDNNMSNIIESIKKEILSWPNVTAEQHKFGGIEFLLNKREMGHIHGDRLADLPFPMKTRDDLVKSGRASPHHVMPQSGWVSYWIEKGEEDVAAIIGLFRLRYEQLKPKSPTKQEEKVEQVDSSIQ